MTAAAGTPDRHPAAASGRGGGRRSGRLRIRGVTRLQILVSLTVLVGLLILFLPIIVIRYSREVAERELEAKLAQMADDGYAVTMEEVGRRYEYPPEEDNAALVFEQANRRLDIPDRIRDELPPYGEWPQLGEPIPPEWVPHIRELLELNEEAIALYREAARLPEARYPVDFTLGWQFPIPHASRLVQAARFFSVLAVWQAGNQEWDQAANSLEILFAAGRSLRDEPILISQLIQIGITGIGCEALERVLAAYVPPPEFLVRMQEVLETETNDEFGMRNAIEAQIAFRVNFFATIRQEPQTFHEIVDDPTFLAWVRTRIYTFSDSLVRDELFYIEMLKDYAQAANEPLPNRLKGFERLDEAVEQRFTESPRLTRRSAEILPSASDAIRTDAQYLARSRATLILVALERFRADYGRLPESLDELVPEYLDPLPKDPISGNPFGYRIEDGWAFITSEGKIRNEPIELRLPAER